MRFGPRSLGADLLFSGVVGGLLSFWKLLQFIQQFRDLAGAARVEILEGNADAAFPMQHRNVAANAELHLASDKIDLYARAALKVEERRSDEASGETEVEDFSPKEQAPVGNKHLCLPLTGIARMTAAIGQRGIDGRWRKRRHDGKRLAFHRPFHPEFAPDRRGLASVSAFPPFIGGSGEKIMRGGLRT